MRGQKEIWDRVSWYFFMWAWIKKLCIKSFCQNITKWRFLYYGGSSTSQLHDELSASASNGKRCSYVNLQFFGKNQNNNNGLSHQQEHRSRVNLQCLLQRNTTNSRMSSVLVLKLILKAHSEVEIKRNHSIRDIYIELFSRSHPSNVKCEHVLIEWRHRSTHKFSINVKETYITWWLRQQLLTLVY